MHLTSQIIDKNVVNHIASSEIETIDEDRGNHSLQTSGNCSGKTSFGLA